MTFSLQEKIILTKLIEHNGTGNVMEFLQYDTSQFDEGFTIANSMQNKDLVKLLYSNFIKNQVVVEATLLAFTAAEAIS
jgi:hypothetical protein